MYDHGHSRRRELAAFPQRALDISLGLSFCFGGPFVIKLLTSSHPDIDFGQSLFEMQAEWNERQSLLLNGNAKAIQFLAMNQELTGAVRIVIGAIAVRVWRNMRADEPKLAIVDASVCFGDRCFSISDRFDLGASEDDTGLNRLQNVKIMERAPVAGYHAVTAPVR